MQVVGVDIPVGKANCLADGQSVHNGPEQPVQY